ncbi:exonuclease [Pseudoalteromonas phage pYD6-A]|uniref:Uncharacterized protein n=1 Tax=Pseudoalteromonas phage pYD6-A TaxID=754052 RepID=M4T3Z5_9CAUD|nr:exonuclease [Pseudoalteromonas phage pYD6-A]AGH57599.1 hypothetical protein PYDG_00070 [Pseudoalteromonas phage pYD6-A]
MANYTNTTGIPLSVGVWLATDSYQYPPDDGKKYISATGLLKSVRQSILSKRIPKGAERQDDIVNRVASRFGTAIHDSIEMSWVNNYQNAMLSLGYPQSVVDRVRINPTDPDEPGIIPVYMEQRFHKEVGDWIVSGQFDFVGDGRLEDFKSTGTFTWTKGNKSQDYIDQGSIYRWGRPDIITQDVMAIQFFFKDWQAFKAKDPNYPPSMLVEKTFKLRDESETDRWIKQKLFALDMHENTPELDLPYCTDKDLWRDPPVWKYYKNPDKTDGRATKNFDNPQEANLRFVQDGSVGIVIEKKSEPKACKYCPAVGICSQAQQFIKSGELKL